MWKTYIFVLIVTLLCVKQVTSMNEKQLAAAMKMVRSVCQPKSKATNDDIEKMHKGDWNIDHTAMCYMQCALNMYKLIGKDNKFDYESAMIQLKILPESMQDFTLACMNQCKDAAVTLDDKCVAGYELAKCVYDCNPERYFLP